MRLDLRARALGKKVTLITTAFVLAVSTLTASVPFILSQRVGAVAGTTVDGISTFADLKAALENEGVGYINLAPKAQISAPEEIVLTRSSVRINGNDSTITYTGPNAGVGGWQGLYVFQAYNVTDVQINSLRVAGADAGFLINGSEVTLKGNTHPLNNEVGGIEVSKGTAVTRNSVLTLEGNIWDESSKEANGKPAVWVVNGQGTVNQTKLNSKLVGATHVVSGQTQYYLRAQNTGTVVTNVTRQTTFTNLQAAIDDELTQAGDTLQLNKDIVLTQPVQLNKGVTVDGNGKTVTSNFDRTSNQQNAGFVVTANGASLRNLTVTTVSTAASPTGFPTKPHGVVAYNATGVVLTNVTLKNNLAGLIVSGAKVTIDGVHTQGSQWYGVDVDKAGAVLTVRGTNTHDEAKHIFVDDSWTGAYVIDQFGKYNREVSGRQITYTLDNSQPVVQSIKYANGNDVDGSRINAGVYTVTVTLTDGTKTAVNYTNFEVRKGGVFKAQGAGGSSLTPSYSLNATNLEEGSDYTLRVYGRDNNNNNFSQTVSFTVDRIAPSATVTYSNNGQATREDVKVTVTTSEASVLPGEWTQDTPTQFSRVFNGNTDPATVTFTDVAGNPATFTYDVNGIDRSFRGAITPITEDTTTPLVTGVVSYTVDGVGVANLPLDVYIDGVPYARTTNGLGVWTVEGVVFANNVTHTVAVFQRGADATSLTNALDSETFTTAVPIVTVPGAPVLQQSPAPSPLVNNQPNGGLPLTTFGAAQVLGNATTNSDNNGTPEVAGSATQNLAQAVDADNTDGTAMGLAWYWWLLIIAAVATIIWGIVAAIRGRQSA